MKEADKFESDGEKIFHKVKELTAERIPIELLVDPNALAMIIITGGATKAQSDMRISEARWWVYNPGRLWVLGNRELYYKDEAEVVKLLQKNAPSQRLPPLYFEHYQSHTGTQGIAMVNLIRRTPDVRAALIAAPHFHGPRFTATCMQHWHLGGDQRRLYLALAGTPDPEVVTDGNNTNQTVEGEIERLNRYMGSDVPELNFVRQVVEQGYIQNP